MISVSDLSNKALIDFINNIEQLCSPKDVYICNGSDEEWNFLCEKLVKSKTFIKLNPKKRPNSYLALSDPSDVARLEDRTFICSKDKKDAGPTNNWRDPIEMKSTLNNLFTNCMEGRSMYVIPFCMGNIESDMSIIGIQITDSPYAVVNMKIMTEMGYSVLEKIKDSGEFISCVHSIGYPLKEHQEDVPWPCNDTKYISHFPDSNEIWSYGSGYGGNSLLGKKCLALRIASSIAKDEGWLAEHMLICGIENPQGEKKYISAAFPSGCGKTNMAMMSLPDLYNKKGWKLTTVGDDIAWLKPDKEGNLRGVNPEKGYFGVATGTSLKSNYNAMKTLSKNTVFTNVALTPDNDVWWEGMTEEIPEKLIDWKGNEWTPKSKTLAAHPNSRFTSPASQCPTIDKNWNSKDGVKIDVIMFGSRRYHTIPLVFRSLSWEHGVFLGSSIISEPTSASENSGNDIRNDPFSMLPFCGYNMGNYFKHWINIKKSIKNLPNIFYVNWFRKDDNGNFLWPGFSENFRVLEWIFNTNSKTYKGIKSSIGYLPNFDDINLLDIGEDFSKEKFNHLMKFDNEKFKKDIILINRLYSKLGETLPKELIKEKERLESIINF